jgi:hypothetical protein
VISISRIIRRNTPYYKQEKKKTTVFSAELYEAKLGKTIVTYTLIYHALLMRLRDKKKGLL